MKQQTLLIVDDELSFLNGMVRALRNEPYEIRAASSGHEALATLKEFAVDVVVADYKMPGLDGLSLLRQIRVDYPLVIPIMLTAVCDLKMVLCAVNEIRVFKFLLKPIRFANLKIAIKLAMEESLNGLCINPEAQLERFCCDLEKKFPGITTVKRDSEGYYIPDV